MLVSVDLSILANPPRFLSLMDFFIYMVKKELEDSYPMRDRDKRAKVTNCLRMTSINPNVEIAELITYITELSSEYDIESNFIFECIDNARYERGLSLEELSVASRYINDYDDNHRLLIDIRHLERELYESRSEKVFIDRYRDSINDVMYDVVYPCLQPSIGLMTSRRVNIDIIRSILDNIIEKKNRISRISYDHLAMSIFAKLHMNPNISWEVIHDITIEFTEKCGNRDVGTSMLLLSPKLTRELLKSHPFLVNCFHKGHYIPFCSGLTTNDELITYEDVINEYNTHGVKSNYNIMKSPHITFEITEKLTDEKTAREYNRRFYIEYSNPYTREINRINTYKQEVKKALPYILRIQHWWIDVSKHNPHCWLARSKLEGLITKLAYSG